jgi:hypothetical protein
MRSMNGYLDNNDEEEEEEEEEQVQKFKKN